MKINKTVAVAIVLVGLLLGGLGAGVFLTQRPTSVNAAPAFQQDTTCPDDDDVQHEAEGEEDDATEGPDCEGNEANEANEADEANETDEANEANGADEADEANEADEAKALEGQAGITAAQAQSAAEAANPGAKTLAVELDNENGTVIYEVELDNGQDVKVDAKTGNILGADARDAD